MAKFVVRTILYKVDGAIETPLAESESMDFTDFAEAADEFDEITEDDLYDCLLVDLKNHGILVDEEDESEEETADAV